MGMDDLTRVIFLLLVFLYFQEAGAVNGNHDLLQSRQKIPLIFPLTLEKNQAFAQ